MSITVRRIQKEDSPAVADIIRSVMPEFGASGQGFAIHDGEVNDMFKAYTQPRCAYFVCVEQGKVLGGGGVAPLIDGGEEVCELKKMYFLAEGRGKGLGQKVLTACLLAAAEIGYEYCYLETFNTMKGAMKLYEKNGFEKISGPMGNTGHFSCDTFYKIKLKK
jgi:putative acetyltransferase